MMWLNFHARRYTSDVWETQMPRMDEPGLRPASDGRRAGSRCRRGMPGPSSDGEQAAGKCQGAGRGWQLPVTPKPAADSLDSVPTLDGGAAVHQMTPAACRQHLPALQGVASDGSAAPCRQMTAHAAQCRCNGCLRPGDAAIRRGMILCHAVSP